MFSHQNQGCSTSRISFRCTKRYVLTFEKADYIRSNSIAIVPVPRNANYTENPNATQVASEVITDFILSKSAYIPESTTNTDTNNNSSDTGE